MAQNETVGIQDVAGVHSRVSWSAIIGGSVVAMSVYVLLGLFFAGVGLSLTEAGVRDGTAAWVAVIANVLSVILALFLGGCTTSILTAGETRREAMIYGLLTWAVVTGFTLWMVGMGMRTGYNAMLSASMVARQDGSQNWEAVARDAGFTQAQVDNMKAQADPAQLRAEANNPANREALHDGAQMAVWGTLVGTLLSLGASVFGAVSGAGPAFRFFPTATVVRRESTLVTS
jgi:type IV secretory pathway TrbD component